MANCDAIVDRAATEIAAFGGWLAERLPDAQRSPRLGAPVYAATLWHSLDDDTWYYIMEERTGLKLRPSESNKADSSS